MRKVVWSCVFILLLFSISACSKEVKSQNAVSEAKLTDREKFILSSTSDYSFVFDFHSNKKYKQVALWVDKYEFGKLAEEKISHLTTEIEGNGTIIFTTSKLIGSQNNSTFNISVGKDGSSSGISTDQVMPKIAQSSGGSNPIGSIPISKNMTLATLSFANGNRMSSLSNKFYKDVERHLSEIETYDVVYVLKAEFQ